MVISVKFLSSCLHSAFRASERMTALVLNESKSKVGKTVNVSLESDGPMFEETRRMQDSIQFTDGK